MRLLIFLLLFVSSVHKLWACGPPRITNAEATITISAPVSVCPGETVDVVINSGVERSQTESPNIVTAALPSNLIFSAPVVPTFFFNNGQQAWPSTLAISTLTTPQTVSVSYSSPADRHACLFGFRAIAAQSGTGTINVTHLDQGVNIGSGSEEVGIRLSNPQLSISGPSEICVGSVANNFFLQANTPGATASNISWSSNPSSLILEPAGVGVSVTVPNGNFNNFSLTASGNATVCGVTTPFSITTYGQIVESGGNCTFENGVPAAHNQIVDAPDGEIELPVVNSEKQAVRPAGESDLANESANSFGSQLAYPNPAYDQLNVPANCAKGETLITLIDVEGRELLKRSVAAGMPTSLDISSIPTGVYLLQQRSDCGYLAQKISVR